MIKGTPENGGKEVLSKNNSDWGALSIDKEDSNVHIGRNQEGRNDGTI